MEKMASKKGKLDIMGNGLLARRTLDLYAMNAGDGPRSYVQNSSYQRGVVDIAKPIIEEEIARKLDIKHPSPTSPNGFWVADFGCSTGHNSFPAMQIITQAIYRKHASSGLITSQIPEFFVFFNDVITNDFNTLFTSLPPRRHYSAIRVPGDFHSRLLPESSLHFAYSSWALQWLTGVPKAVVERDSPAWNSRAILYTRDRKEVCDAYLNQYAKDIEAFLEARAVEMVSGGLMALLVPAVPAFWNPETEYTIPCDLNLLGSCLVDMAKKVTTKVGNLNRTRKTRPGPAPYGWVWDAIFRVRGGSGAAKTCPGRVRSGLRVLYRTRPIGPDSGPGPIPPLFL
ncbi:UNVERIFIED_CONTAM: Loganic acid O-methyltransferase [Sesamum radiatum]|uniref:Loganic acid O-methyltransferase n=1 Tax=Sesamum radiatum TaxID=300843 RepID=A0AAW2V644_SESRA